MANDDKMKRKTKSETVISGIEKKFLPEEIVDIDGDVEVYSLEKEFAKTKKNRNWIVIVIIVAFLSVMVAMALFFTFYTENKNSTFRISFNEFNDLRLKEVLESARMHDNNLIIRRNELFRVIIQKRKGELFVKNKYLDLYNALLDGSGSWDDKKLRLETLKKKESGELSKIGKKYNKKIMRMKRSIRAIIREKHAAEKKLVEARKKGELYEDEGLIHDLKMKKLDRVQRGGLNSVSNYYDKYVKYIKRKYNPKFKWGESLKLLKRNGKKDIPLKINPYDPILSSEDIMSRAKFDSIRQRVSDRRILVERLMGVGYFNSVPIALRSLNNISNGIVNDYEHLAFSLTKSLKYKKKKIEDYKRALDVVLQERPESGYVISPADLSKISIHINRLIRLKNGDLGLVFRDSDKYIGRIKFYKTSKGFFAKAIEVAPGQKMKPFDRILIKFK